MEVKADAIDEEEEKKDKAYKNEIDKISFAKRLSPYNKPIFNVIIGLIASGL